MTKSVMAALLAALVWVGALAAQGAGGDFTYDSTVDANVDRVVWGVISAHRITGAHSAFVSWNGTAGSGRLLGRSYSDSNNNYNLRVQSDGTARANASSSGVGGAGYNVTSTSTSGLDALPHQMMVVYNASTAVIYYDGILEATDASVATPDNPNFGISIGCSGNGVGGYGVGDAVVKIEGAAVFNVELLEAEAAAWTCLNCLRRPLRGLVFHVPFYGVPGLAFGGAGTVVDQAEGKNGGDGNDGSPDPSYSEGWMRGWR